jgi:hypothetical protein
MSSTIGQANGIPNNAISELLPRPMPFLNTLDGRRPLNEILQQQDSKAGINPLTLDFLDDETIVEFNDQQIEGEIRTILGTNGRVQGEALFVLSKNARRRLGDEIKILAVKFRVRATLINGDKIFEGQGVHTILNEEEVERTLGRAYLNQFSHVWFIKRKNLAEEWGSLSPEIPWIEKSAVLLVEELLDGQWVATEVSALSSKKLDEQERLVRNKA